MVSLKRIQEIEKEIKDITSVGIKYFDGEFEKFNNRLSNAIKEFNDESIKVKRDLVNSAREIDKIQEKKAEIEEEYNLYKKKLDSLNKKELELTEKEEEQLKLHTILNNKGKVIKAREREVEEKERRLNDR